jgi:serine/alanine adding enzyme
VPDPVLSSPEAGRPQLAVSRADPTEAAAWDRFVEASGGTFCHLAAWGPLLREVMGAEPLYMEARDGSGLEGVLPLYRVKSRLFGHYLVSVPYLNYGGPIGSAPACRLLTEAAMAEARESSADLMELRLRTRLDEVPDGVRRTDRKITVLLDLPEEPDVLFKDVFRAKLRSQIRRPMKEGMEFRSGPGEVEPFVSVFQRNMRDLGTPVLPAALFRRLPEAFGDKVTFGSVYLGDRAVAVGCGFTFGGEFEMTWASSLAEFNRQSPNMLLYWGFMERAIESGLARFNFGRCTPGGGTHRFKKQWESRDEPLPWLQWSEEGLEATPSPESGKYALAIRAWQKLPLPVANLLGPYLSRRIP